MDIRVRLLDFQDKVEFTNLLRYAFFSVREVKASQGTLQWTPTDSYYTVLGLFKNDRLVSMMRIEWISTTKELVMKLDETKYPWDFQFPIGYLAKAATLPSESNFGYNTYLRYLSFKIFLNWKVHGVLGSMIEGSPRVEIMKQMGYEFFTKETKWNGNLKSDMPVLIGYLNGQQRIIQALQFIERKIPDLISQVNLDINLETVQMVPKIKMNFPWEK